MTNSALEEATKNGNSIHYKKKNYEKLFITEKMLSMGKDSIQELINEKLDRAE